MLRLSIDKDKLKLSNDTSSICFSLSNEKIFKVIRASLESLKDTRSGISIDKTNENNSILKLDNNNILIDNLTTYEISTRMLLLNKHLRYPETATSE